MPLAITDEHRQLAAVARSFAERHRLLQQARTLLDAPDESVTPVWKELAEVGWLGLHLPAAYGGQGFGLPELAVVVEELGRAIAPGPFLPTVIVSALIAGSGDHDLAERWLPGLADGSLVGAIGFGTMGLCAGLADVIVLGRDDDLVVLGRDEVSVTARQNVDHTRRVATVTATEGAGTVLAGRRRDGLAIARALAASEAAGLAHACTEMASEYAKVRQQFGRPIGSFMAVKHHCANMRVQAELATAAAWDAARAVVQAGTGSRAGRARWPPPWRSRRPSSAPRPISRSTVELALPGSTTPTFTCAGPRPSTLCSAAGAATGHLPVVRRRGEPGAR